MMGALVYNGHAFEESYRSKTVEMRPLVDGRMRCAVKVYLDGHAKLSVRDACELRHKLNALLAVKDGVLVLPEEPGLEYHGAHITDADPWSDLFETGSTVVTFECADGVAYGAERATTAETIDVKGTADTYPTIEFVAAEGDSVMVLNLDTERFVNIVHAFNGGERVAVDFERETAAIDGADACADIGFYSDFFSLAPGENRLVFAGCSSHMTRYYERWR